MIIELILSLTVLSGCGKEKLKVVDGHHMHMLDFDCEYFTFNFEEREVK